VQTIHALLVQHSINVMHVEKNVCEIVVKTSFEEKDIVKMLRTWRHLVFGGIYILYTTLHDLEWYYSMPHHMFYQSKRTQRSCARWQMYWCLRTIVVHCRNTWQKESCWAWKHMIGMCLCNNNCLCVWGAMMRLSCLFGHMCAKVIKPHEIGHIKRQCNHYTICVGDGDPIFHFLMSWHI
jgi:hypothetical protein